ncbi:hypothetical protein [Pseudoduganella chitinolytica]|uniref:Uncharacterized protein n=1 Tax=Pseudoduganella chitinolytica TaxID=34070 RepID=A0ABY8BIV8_9BURK|nr:hypothetical protein [Pseudoduganella chitinolytica]WEF35313.1 hypothetical protein PX653_11330 [Pseudoduganella chitinolytica]
MPKIEFAALKCLAETSASVTAPCRCNRVPLAAWSALPMTLELDRFEEIGVLFDDPYDEPTFAEFHPAGTRYDSDAAPIAPRFYPYNRCTVARCLDCDRHYLRYNEAGGYFTELRIRALLPELLVDVPTSARPAG